MEMEVTCVKEWGSCYHVRDGSCVGRMGSVSCEDGGEDGGSELGRTTGDQTRYEDCVRTVEIM